MKILNRFDEGTIFEADAATMRDLVAAARKSGANLYRANLSGADLSGADLSDAYLSDANLSGADLFGAKINWQSHALLSEILRRAARDSVERRMIAGLIAISTDWCWDQLLKIDHPEKEWALRTVAACIVEGDGHPEVLNAYVEDGGDGK